MSAKRRKNIDVLMKILVINIPNLSVTVITNIVWYDMFKKIPWLLLRMPWTASMNGSTSSTTQSRRNHQLPMLHPSQRKWHSSTAWSSMTRNWSGGSAGCWLKLRSVLCLVVVGYSSASDSHWFKDMAK